MNKKFILLSLLPVFCLVCLGATVLIHDYPYRDPIVGTDLFLLDTGTAYVNTRYSTLSNQLFTAPTISSPIVTGTFTVSGAEGTNEFNGVNALTNINTTTIPSPFVLAESATNKLHGLYYGTNQGSLTINLALGKWFGFSTNDNFDIAGISGVSAFGTNVQEFALIITNTAGAEKLMTVPASWIKTGGVDCWITNQGKLTGFVYPGLGTNAEFICLK